MSKGDYFTVSGNDLVRQEIGPQPLSLFTITYNLALTVPLPGGRVHAIYFALLAGCIFTGLSSSLASPTPVGLPKRSSKFPHKYHKGP